MAKGVDSSASLLPLFKPKLEHAADCGLGSVEILAGEGAAAASSVAQAGCVGMRPPLDRPIAPIRGDGKRNPSRGCVVLGNLPSCSTSQCCLFCSEFGRVCAQCCIEEGTRAPAVSKMNKACLPNGD